MHFQGIVKGRGGKYFGDGGFVEVSEKEELFFDGSVDTSAANGKTGTLLLDPTEIRVEAGSAATTSGAATFATISKGTLEGISGTTNIILQADELITIDLGGDSLNLQQGSGNSVTFRTTKNTITRDSNGNITEAVGDILMVNTNDNIITQGGDIIFEAKGELKISSLTSNGGNILITGRTLQLSGNINSGAGDVTIGSNSNIHLGGSGLSGCGDGTASLCDMSIVQSELDNISGNKLTIGGTLTRDIFVNGVTLTSFSDGVVLDVDTHVSGSDGAIVFQAGSSFSSLEAKAVNGINVDANVDIVTTTGALSFDGDSDSGADSLDPKDNITFASGATLTSATSISLSAITGGMSAARALTLNAPTSITMTGNLTAAGTVSLTASSGINLNGGITTSSGDLSIDANSSVLTLGSGITLSSTGALSLSASNTTAEGSLTLTSTGSTINVDNALVSQGAVTMTANSGLTLGNNTLTGNINLQGGSSLSLASGMNISGGSITLGGTTITANNGSLTLSSTGSITVNNSLTSVTTASLTASSGLSMAGLSANGTVDLNSGTGSTTITGAVTTTNSALNITASDLVLTGSLNPGTSATTISVSNSGNLGLGFVSGFSGMNLSNAELALITGDLNLINGSITVASGTSLNLVGKLTIGESGGSITGQEAMTLSATTGLIINTSSIISAGDITLAATTGNITTAGAITLESTGAINLNNNFTGLHPGHTVIGLLWLSQIFEYRFNSRKNPEAMFPELISTFGKKKKK